MALSLFGGEGQVKKIQKRNPVAAVLFLCYGALMVYLLFVRNRAVTDGLPYWEQIKNNCNFAPWYTVGNYWDVLTRPEYYIEKWGTYAIYRYRAQVAVVNILGNVAMFVPYGVFLPTMWPSLQRAWKAIPMGMLTIALVEICQLFTLRGRCDVDDVLLNMMGIILGYGLWRLVEYCCRKRK